MNPPSVFGLFGQLTFKIDIDLRLITEEVFTEHKNACDLVAFGDIPSLKVKKDMLVRELRELVAKTVNVNPLCMRLWKFAKRDNKTIRFDCPIGSKIDEEPIDPSLRYFFSIFLISHFTVNLETN